MSSAMPLKVEAQNITSAGLLEPARSLRPCCSTAAASCAAAVSLMLRRSSCRSMSLCIDCLRYGCRCLGSLGCSHDDPTGHSHYRGTIGNVAYHEGVRSYLRSVANL